MLPTIFVSYSGRGAADKAFAKHLLARLEEQQLRPWIYETIGQEVPPRSDIRAYCRTQIRKADLFIAIVSDSGFESAAAQDEVTFALRSLEPHEIYQIVTTDKSPVLWPRPYAQLAAFKHRRVRPGMPEELERAVGEVCEVLGVSYEPPMDGGAKLPLVKRLTSELDEAQPRAMEYENGIFTRLRGHALKVSRLHNDRRFDEALMGADHLVHELRDEFPDHRFYYPVVVKGVLEATVGRDRADHLIKAEQTFTRLIEHHKPFGTHDENAIAGLAGVRLALGDRPGAYDLYCEAHDWATAHDRVDPDLIHNMLVAALASGDLFATARVESLLDATPEVAATQDPYLKDRLRLIRAIAAASLGDIRRAETALAAVSLGHEHVVDLTVRLAQELCEQAMFLNSAAPARTAERLLSMLADDERAPVRRAARLALASMQCCRGYPHRALELLLPLHQANPQDVQLIVEVALCYHAQGDTTRARHMCFSATSLALAALGANMSERELRQSLYFRGLAHWLLGQEELARRDFRDAQFEDAPWYAQLQHRAL